MGIPLALLDATLTLCRTSQLIPSLPAPLTPFFHLTHPTRGSLLGPWAKLPLRTQIKALDLVRYLLEDSSVEEKVKKSLRKAVGKALEKGKVDEVVQERWRGM